VAATQLATAAPVDFALLRSVNVAFAIAALDARNFRIARTAGKALFAFEAVILVVDPASAFGASARTVNVLRHIPTSSGHAGGTRNRKRTLRNDGRCGRFHVRTSDKR